MLTTGDATETGTIDAAAVMAEETAAQLGTYAKLPIVATRGAGIFIYDATGRTYYDFYCGHAVTLLGHCPPAVVGAIQSQAARLIFYSNMVFNEVRADYAAALTAAAPAGYGQVFFCNSGAEANETALKLARKWAYRVKGVPRHQAEIITAAGNFHGRTISIVTFSTEPLYRDDFGPFTPDL